MPGDDAERGDGAALRERRRAPDEAQRDQREPDRQREIGDPGRDADGDDVARRAIAPHERDAAEAEQRRHRGADGGGEDVRDVAERPFGMNSPVASVSSLPSRAAMAAPKRPTQSVRFWAN